MKRARITQTMSSFRAKVIMTIAVAALGFVAVASPASAYTIDRPKITAVGSDFGNTFNSPDPLDGGTLEWVAVGSKIKPVLKGEMYLQQPAGVQAYIEVEYFDVDATGEHSLGNAVSQTRTATAAVTDTFIINMGSFTHAKVDHVHIKLWDNSTGVWAAYPYVWESL